MRMDVGVQTSLFSRTNQRDYRETGRGGDIGNVPNCGFKRARIGDIDGRNEKKETIS